LCWRCPPSTLSSFHRGMQQLIFPSPESADEQRGGLCARVAFAAPEDAEAAVKK
jgi:hypothetical protein